MASAGRTPPHLQNESCARREEAWGRPPRKRLIQKRAMGPRHLRPPQSGSARFPGRHVESPMPIAMDDQGDSGGGEEKRVKRAAAEAEDKRDPRVGLAKDLAENAHGGVAHHEFAAQAARLGA